MSQERCRAKNPETCSYHHPEIKAKRDAEKEYENFLKNQNIPEGAYVYRGTGGIYILDDPRSKGTKLNLEKGQGEKAEEEVRRLFQQAKVPKEWIYKPAYVRVSNGELEISDGLVEYGNSMFLLQIKSTHDASGTPEIEGRKFEQRKTLAYKQAKENLAFLKENPSVEFENLSENKKVIDADNYFWYALVIVHYDEFPEMTTHKSTVTNDIDGELPRIALTTGELEEITTFLSTVQLLNFLRRLTKKDHHIVGSLKDVYFEYVDNGLYQPKNNSAFLPMLDALVLQNHENGSLNKDNARRILDDIDGASVKTLAPIQRQLTRSYENPKFGGRKSGNFEIGRTIYRFEFYNSELSDWTYLNNPISYDGVLRTYEGLSDEKISEIDLVVCVNFDVSKPGLDGAELSILDAQSFISGDYPDLDLERK